MTSLDRIQEHLRELQISYDLLSEKITRLRKAIAVETDISAKFKLEKELEQAEKERRTIHQDIEKGEKEISSQLEYNSNDDKASSDRLLQELHVHDHSIHPPESTSRNKKIRGMFIIMVVCIVVFYLLSQTPMLFRTLRVLFQPPPASTWTILPGDPSRSRDDELWASIPCSLKLELMQKSSKHGTEVYHDCLKQKSMTACELVTCLHDRIVGELSQFQYFPFKSPLYPIKKVPKTLALTPAFYQEAELGVYVYNEHDKKVKDIEEIGKEITLDVNGIETRYIYFIALVFPLTKKMGDIIDEEISLNNIVRLRYDEGR